MPFIFFLKLKEINKELLQNLSSNCQSENYFSIVQLDNWRNTRSKCTLIYKSCYGFHNDDKHNQKLFSHNTARKDNYHHCLSQKCNKTQNLFETTKYVTDYDSLIQQQITPDHNSSISSSSVSLGPKKFQTKQNIPTANHVMERLCRQKHVTDLM